MRKKGEPTSHTQTKNKTKPGEQTGESSKKRKNKNSYLYNKLCKPDLLDSKHFVDILNFGLKFLDIAHWFNFDI